jgi:hypothetical protein
MDYGITIKRPARRQRPRGPAQSRATIRPPFRYTTSSDRRRRSSVVPPVMSTNTHDQSDGCQEDVGMTMQGERSQAVAASAPRRAGRIAGGIGLGLFGHGLALVPVVLAMLSARGHSNNTETLVMGIYRFLVVEVILAIVVATSVVVRLVQRRSRDLAVGLLIGWLVPMAAFGIVTGIADLRQ